MPYDPSPYLMPTNLDFGGAPVFGDYNSAYSKALYLNQQLYNNAQQGFAGLQKSVLGDIQGIDSSQRQAIEDTYAQQSGAATQGMIAHGLGNSTVQSAVQRGLTLDKMKADNQLTNQTQGLVAGYKSNIGLAQLAAMGGVTAPFPAVGPYAQLAMMRGMMDQANRYKVPMPQGGYGTAGGKVNMPTGFGMGGMGGMQGVGGNMGYGGGGYGGGGDSYSRPAGQALGGTLRLNAANQSSYYDPYGNINTQDPIYPAPGQDINEPSTGWDPWNDQSDPGDWGAYDYSDDFTGGSSGGDF